MFLSSVSLPNVVQLLFVGFFLDSVTGPGRGALVFSSLAMLGHVWFSAAVGLHSFAMAVVGRVLFGKCDGV